MKNSRPDYEEELAKLRAEVARLRQTLIYGFIGMGAVLFLVFGAPWVALIVIFFAGLVLVVGTIGALLGSLTGKAIRQTRRFFGLPNRPLRIQNGSLPLIARYPGR